MYKGKKILGIIPARGGSKGLPGKNIKTIYGKPLIEWTIDVANKSELLDYFFVSTDDEDLYHMLLVVKLYHSLIEFLQLQKVVLLYLQQLQLLELLMVQLLQDNLAVLRL